MDTTNEMLHEIVIAYPQLTRAKIAELAMCASKSTVDRWLLPPKVNNKRNPGYRRMPEHRMKLLLDAIKKKRLKMGVDMAD